MDRIEIPMEGEVARWVEAAERGDEVVITENGRVRASVTPSAESGMRGHIDREKLSALRASVPPEFRSIDWTAEIRAMRDEDRF